MKQDEKVVKYYDGCLKDYFAIWTTKKDLALHYGFWDKRTKNKSEALLRMNKFLADKAGIKQSDVILDAGCGIGGSSIWLAKNYGTRVFGINISKNHIKLANMFAKENRINHLAKFFVRNFLDTKFKNNSFNVVWGIESVCHANDKKDFISEAKRVLKRGGRLIIADGFIKKDRLNKNEKKVLKKWLDGWAVPNISKIKDFKNYLEMSGFRNIRFFDITEKVIPSSKKLYEYSLIAFPLGKILEWLNIRSKTQTGNIIAAYNQYKLLKNGLCSYGVFYAEK